MIYKFNQYHNISDDMRYHLDNNILLNENVFRYGSESFFNLINEARYLYENDIIKFSIDEVELLKTDIGLKDFYNGEEVWLDIPMLADDNFIDENKKLNSPMRSNDGKKPYKVYVKNDKGNVIVVRFGSSMPVKLDDPEAVKNYVSRHRCKTDHKDKTKPGYWSCRLPRYAKNLGLAYTGSAQWW